MNVGFIPAGDAGELNQITSIFNRRFTADLAAIEELPHD